MSDNLLGNIAIYDRYTNTNFDKFKKNKLNAVFNLNVFFVYYTE